MAKQATGIELPDPRGKQSRKYPWKEMLNGKTWLLVRGEDYTVTDEAMRSAAYMYARRKSLLVTTHSGEQGIYVRFAQPKRTGKRLPPVGHVR